MPVLYLKNSLEMIRQLISLSRTKGSLLSVQGIPALPLIVYPQWNVTQKWIFLSSMKKYNLNLVSISLSQYPFNWHFASPNEKAPSPQSQLLESYFGLVETNWQQVEA